MTIHIVVPVFWVAWLILGAFVARANLRESPQGSRPARVAFGAYLVLMGTAHYAADRLDELGLWVTEKTLLRAQS